MLPNATERKVLVVCAFFSGWLLAAPREWIGAFVAWSLGAIVLAIHLVLYVRQRRTAAPARAVAPAPPADAPSDSAEAATETSVE